MVEQNASLSPFVAGYSRRNEGSVAVTLALCILAILVIAGAAIDFRRAETTKAFLQSSLDSALLAAAGSHSTDSTMSDARAEEIASAYFTKNLQGSDYGYEVGSFSLTRPEGENTYVAQVSGTLPTSILGLAGINRFDLSVGAEVTVTEPDTLEVMLVLDNTNSMAGGKLSDLKASAKDLVGTLLVEESDTTKIGVVPYAAYVNVGLGQRHEPWLDVEPDSSWTETRCRNTYPDAEATGEFESVMVTERYDCVRVSYTCLRDGLEETCYRNDCRTRTVEVQREIIDRGEPEEVCTNRTRTRVWHGCVGSRDHPLNTRDDGYSTQVPGLMNTECTAPILPLTNDKEDVEDYLDAMFVRGDTYSPTGLIWGLRALSPGAPFDQANEYNSTYENEGVKAMVFMTDGVNSLSKRGIKHDGRDRDASDDLTLEVCSEIKAKGIRLYTVSFELPDADAKVLLEACSSGPGSYFDAEDRAALDQAFQDIADSLVNIHLSN